MATIAKLIEPNEYDRAKVLERLRASQLHYVIEQQKKKCRKAIGDPHAWSYLKDEWTGVLRRCRKCRLYEFHLECWTDGTWKDRVIDNRYIRAEVVADYGPTLAAFAYDFLLPLQRSNEKLKKRCKKKEK